MEGRDFPFSRIHGCVVVTPYVQAQIICNFLLDAVVHVPRNCFLVTVFKSIYCVI